MTGYWYSRRTSVSLLFLAPLLFACGGGGGGGGSSGPGAGAIWLIPADEVVDGGPGQDGIPAIDNPRFEPVSQNATTGADELIIGVRYGGATKAYPHEIMDWHEIVNDGPSTDPFAVSYCPLTGSAVTWKGNTSHANSTFGTSGLLYNSNLILYDRQSSSFWSQMLEQSVSGSRIREVPERIQTIETTMSTWMAMFPNSQIMTTNTGHVRNYGAYPYGNYKVNTGLLFPVNHEDNRLHPKTRAIGVRDGLTSKVYQIDGFGDTTQAINDQVGAVSVVAVGNTLLNFAVIFDRELGDGTILTFTAINGDLPNILQDDEGNVWDVFGTAVSGPRTGEQLGMTNSFIAMWFAWVAFFNGAEIHFN